jgi:polygalacturonase
MCRNATKVAKRIAFVLCCLVVGGAGASCASPTASSRTTSPPGMLNVADFGAAANDPAADNTAAFQNALDSAGKQGGGMVMVPLGRYAFQGTLTLPANVV